MGYFTGRDGHVEYSRLLSNGGRDTKQVAKVRNWSLDTQVRLLPTTTLGDFADGFTPGLKGCTGSCELIYYRFEPGEALNTTHYQFTALVNRIIRRGAITDNQMLRLTLNMGPGGSDDITVDAFINSARLSSAVGELAVAPIQFTATGDFIDTLGTGLGAPYAE